MTAGVFWGIKCRRGTEEWWYPRNDNPALGSEADARDKAERRNDNDCEGISYRVEPYPHPDSLHATDPMFREVDEQLHRLWTWSVGLPGYDKKAWQKLEQGIFDIAKRSTRKQP